MDSNHELKPCPFCGAGETRVIANGPMWTGKSYGDPVSVSVRHWCTPVAGQPSRMIERIGRDESSAVAAWNTRTATPPEPESAQPAQSDDMVRIPRSLVAAACFAIDKKRDAPATLSSLREVAMGMPVPPEPESVPEGWKMVPVAATHIGYDYLDNGQLVATYAVPVTRTIAPTLYAGPVVAAPADEVRGALRNLAQYPATRADELSAEGMRDIARAGERAEGVEMNSDTKRREIARSALTNLTFSAMEEIDAGRFKVIHFPVMVDGKGNTTVTLLLCDRSVLDRLEFVIAALKEEAGTCELSLASFRRELKERK